LNKIYQRFKIAGDISSGDEDNWLNSIELNPKLINKILSKNELNLIVKLKMIKLFFHVF
jgi:hypothetical protein